jgi:hypothetical protein
LLPAAGFVAKKASDARQGAQIDRLVRNVRGVSQ